MAAACSDDAHLARDVAASANAQLDGTLDEEAPTEETETTNFFSLSPELRNRIYEESLIDRNHINVSTATPLQEPALLMASRQIRAEASPNWWCRNGLDIVVNHCNTTAATAFGDMAQYAPGPAEERRKIQTFIAYSGRPNWKNLVKWCQKVHSGDIGAAPAAPHIDPQQNMMAIVHSATTLADHLQRQPWAECKKALEIMRPSFGRVDTRWLDNS